MKRAIRRGAAWGATILLAAALAASVVPTVSAAPPTAVDDTVNTPIELATFNVLTNDTGVGLKVVDVIVSAEGIQADCEIDGACMYLPIDGPDYTDTFEYQVQNSTGEIDTGVVTVNVLGNQPTEEDVNSSVTLRYNKRKKVFRGSVIAGQDACTVDRTVQLKKGKKTVGVDTTNQNGSWTIKHRAKKGQKYKAVVKPSTVEGTPTLNCLGDKSPVYKR